MRKIIFLMHVSLDGFVGGPNGEMDWIVYHDDMEADAHSLHSQTDTAIYGRVTYQMMESYWPTVLDDPEATPSAMEHAMWVKSATKVVVSRSLEGVTWEGSLLIRDNVAEEIAKLKQQDGKDMWLLGSPTLAQYLMQHDLIDEYRLNINPVILGKGIPLFKELTNPLNLTLTEARTFKGGVVGLRYERKN